MQCRQIGVTESPSYAEMQIPSDSVDPTKLCMALAESARSLVQTWKAKLNPLGRTAGPSKQDRRVAVDVLFLVEHVDRELDVVTCLMERLRSQYGLRVATTGYYYDFVQNLGVFQPQLIVFPFFYGADHEYPIRYINNWLGAKLVNLGWEQILNRVDIGMKIPRDETARDRVMHICWTEQHRQFLAQHGVPLVHLPLTGNPVMKLYDPPYRGYFKSRQELAERYGLDIDKRWVLFPESYQFAFFSEDRLKHLVRDQNADPDLLRQAKDYSIRSLRSLLEWTSNLDQSDPLFILRPRPSTTMASMMDFVQDATGRPPANLKIIKNESAREWILASDHVISSHSTTLIEAAVAGKSIHVFSPTTHTLATEADWHALVPLLSNRDELLEAIRRPAPETQKPLADWARECFLGAGDPLQLIADQIAKFHNDGNAGDDTPIVVPKGAWNVRRSDEIAKRATMPNDIFDGRVVDARRSRWHQILNGHSTEPLKQLENS